MPLSDKGIGVLVDVRFAVKEHLIVYILALALKSVQFELLTAAWRQLFQQYCVLIVRISKIGSNILGIIPNMGYYPYTKFHQILLSVLCKCDEWHRRRAGA